MFTAQGAQMPIYQFRCKDTTKFASVQIFKVKTGTERRNSETTRDRPGQSTGKVLDDNGVV